MKKYTASILNDDLTVKKIYSVHYFEYSPDYAFPGEKHGFWEMIYIDKGQAVITSGTEEILLSQGEAYFHAPDEWHTIKSTKTSPQVIILGFDCQSPAMNFFNKRCVKVGQKQKELISKIISEYTNCFDTPLNKVFCYKLTKRGDTVFGSQQLLKNYISELLIMFFRTTLSDRQYPLISKNNDDSRLNFIINYMHSHIEKTLTIPELEKCSSLNKSTICRLFRETFSSSPMQYFHNMKIERAKQLLRENNYNVSQISEILGYSSVHYFSRQFKKLTNMSPIEYSRSVKALIPK